MGKLREQRGVAEWVVDFCILQMRHGFMLFIVYCRFKQANSNCKVPVICFTRVRSIDVHPKCGVLCHKMAGQCSSTRRCLARF